MSYPKVAREFVKAAIRAQYGSLLAFEQRHGLPRESVSDVLRGRANARVQSLIDQVLGSPHAMSGNPADSSAGAVAHRLNEAAE